MIESWYFFSEWINALRSLYREAVIKHSLVHKVFLDFFEHAPAKQRMVSVVPSLTADVTVCCLYWCLLWAVLQEMIEAIREAVVYMAHTHDGARVTMHCLWHGTPKVSTPLHSTLSKWHSSCLLLVWHGFVSALSFRIAKL